MPMVGHQTVDSPAAPSGYQRLAAALRDLERARAAVDVVLRDAYPVGVGITFVKGTQRRHGVVHGHGHDGTVTVQVAEGERKKVRVVAAHEIRS